MVEEDVGHRDQLIDRFVDVESLEWIDQSIEQSIDQSIDQPMDSMESIIDRHNSMETSRD
jgi:hypothetical protein